MPPFIVSRPRLKAALNDNKITLSAAACNRISTVTVNCIIILLVFMHVLRATNQIKPFQQKSTKVHVPFTEDTLLY